MTLRRRTLLVAAALFLLNAYIVLRLFTTEYTQQIGSIEAAFISIARYARDNWRDLTWWPLWYGGMPYESTYQPGLHLAVASVSGLFRLSAASAYHLVTATTYCLGPVACFWLAYRLSQHRLAAAAAGLLLSVWSPAALLMPSVRGDAGGLTHARRLQALVKYGEGPNVTGLMLMMLAVGALHLALERRTPGRIVLAVLALAAVPLTSWPSSVVLSVATACYLFSREPRQWTRSVAWTIGLGALAYALASPWIPPATVLQTYQNTQTMGEAPVRNATYYGYWTGLLVLLLLLRLVLQKVRVPAWLRFALLFTLGIGWIPMMAEWRGVYLLPQPLRFHLAMEIGVVLTLVFAGAWLLPRRRTIQWTAAALLLVVATRQAMVYRRHAREMIRPVAMTSRIEYRMSRWFDEHMQGRRVFLSGSVAFWLNAFTDTPQLTGCCEQGVINRQMRAAPYEITTGDGAGPNPGRVAVIWLKAFGIHATGVHGPRSEEIFHDFRHPGQYEGLLPVLWRDGDDTIYGVPHRSPSLARIVRRTEVVARPPENGIDLEWVSRYVAALDDAALPLAEFVWQNRHHGRISASLQPEHVVSVQMNYHPGWRATVNGQPCPIHSDGLGLIVIEPACHGVCDIDLIYTGDPLAKLYLAASLLTVAALVLLTFQHVRRAGMPAR